MIELAFCTIAFRNDPIEQVLPKVAEIGYDASEVFWGHLEGRSDVDLRAIRAISEYVKMPTLVLSPYLCFTRGDEEYAASIDRAAACVNAARILRASKIRTFTDVGPTGIGSDTATAEQWTACIDGLKAITSMASELTFVLETHEKTLADTGRSVRRLMAAVAAPNLKLLIHPAAKSEFGETEGFRLFCDVVDHMHLNNRTAEGEMTWVEQGVFDYADYLRQVVADGYRGSVSVEYCFAGATWELAASAHEYLRECLKHR